MSCARILGCRKNRLLELVAPGVDSRPGHHVGCQGGGGGGPVRSHDERGMDCSRWHPHRELIWHLSRFLDIPSSTIMIPVSAVMIPVPLIMIPVPIVSVRSPSQRGASPCQRGTSPVVGCAGCDRLPVVPPVAQVALPPRVWSRVLIMWLMWGGGVGVTAPEKGVTSYVPVPRGGERYGGGPVNQLLQNFLT